MAKEFYTTIIASGGFAGESYDVNQGPLATDVIDALLQNAATSFLQINTPISLISTGTIVSSRNLDLSGIEQDGRLFFLSVQNTDLSSTVSLTVVPGTSINSNPDLEIFETGDYIFVHTGSGNWRAQAVLTADEKSNLQLELEFKLSQLSNYKTLSYTGNNLTTVNTYVDNTLTELLFTKSLSYTGNNLTQTTLTRLADGATVVKNLTYTGNRLTAVQTIA